MPEQNAHIGIYFPTSGSGGARRHLLEIVKYWSKEKGVTLTLFAPFSLTQMLSEANVKLIPIDKVSLLLPYRLFWELTQSALFSSIDILFVPLGSYIGFKKPFVTMSRNLLLYDIPEIKRINSWKLKLGLTVNRWVQILTFRNAARIIFISEHARNVISTFDKRFLSRSEIIHHGLDHDFFKNDRSFRSINSFNKSDLFKLLYVSSFYEYKRHENLLMAVSALAERYPVQLLLVGSFSDGHIRTRIQKIASDLNERFEYQVIQILEETPLDKILHIYHQADLFVFPSVTENMPNILIEAMASALPIACSDALPMPEFLKDGGLYFNSDDVEDMIGKIDILISDADLRSKLGNKAAALAGGYSWKITAEKTMQVILNEIQYKIK